MTRPRRRPAPPLAVLLGLVCLLLAAAPARAQSCEDALTDAEGHYLAGRFDVAIARLDACLERGALSRPARQRAYRLIGLSYIGQDLRAEARRAVERLLELVPDYAPDPVDDPPPFVALVEELRREAPGRPPDPTGQLGDLTLALGAAPYERDLRTLFADPEGGLLTFTARTDDPAVADAALAGPLLTLHPRGAGRTQLVLTAVDAGGLRTSRAVAVTVGAATTPATAERSGPRLGRWLLIGGAVVAGGVAAAVLAGGAGGDTGGGGPIGGPPPLPGAF